MLIESACYEVVQLLKYNIKRLSAPGDRRYSQAVTVHYFTNGCASSDVPVSVSRKLP